MLPTLGDDPLEPHFASDRQRGRPHCPEGHSDFEALRTKAGAATAAYVAFNLLQLAGKDIRHERLEDRSFLVASLLGLRYLHSGTYISKVG